MFNPSDRRGGGGGGGGDDDRLATMSLQEYQQQPDDDQIMSDDDDNAQLQPDLEEEGDNKEDPFQLALDDLEGRVISALDNVKLHPGVRTNMHFRTVQDELAALLRPVLEVAAHTAASVARTYYYQGSSGGPAEGVEASCEEAYQRVVSDLTLPVLLEMAQSETVASKRTASLEFFRSLFKECQKPGSWLDLAYMNANAGPYGSGSTAGSSSGPSSSSSSKHRHHEQRQPAAQLQRRRMKRLQREGEMLRYWVQASVACTQEGVFTAQAAEAVVASRGVIAASASIRPSLKHVAQRIKDADDRGASRVFGPVMKMGEGVLNRLFLSKHAETAADLTDQGDTLRSACIKFLEILCLACSSKPQDPAARRRGHSPDDFSLDDLPAGHPSITREALESIADYGFSALRGLTLLGGQIKLDTILVDGILKAEATGSHTTKIVSILKTASLPYLELEASLPDNRGEEALEIAIDRPSMDFNFVMSQKSHALSINAISALASNRPVFFKEGAVCLARRCADPPLPPTAGEVVGYGQLSRHAALAVQSQLKASCLTLLRNALSVQTNSSSILHMVLKKCDMALQADKALKMAQQTTALKTAGRAARNRANMFYEWETSAAADERTSKRRRETDDALAQVRAAKAARGLGNGIQLPTSTVDAMELVMANVGYLPEERPVSSTASTSQGKKVILTLETVVDAIMTNGASLVHEEGRWFSRDGGHGWTTAVESDGGRKYELSANLPAQADGTVDEEQKTIFSTQCQAAASEAFGRIVASSLDSRKDDFSVFTNNLAARLAWALDDVAPSWGLKSAHETAMETKKWCDDRIDDKTVKEAMGKLVETVPLVASSLSLAPRPDSEVSPTFGESSSLRIAMLNEAYLQASCKDFGVESGENEQNNDSWKYDSSLDLIVGTVVQSSQMSVEKPGDAERKRVANQLTASIRRELGMLPKLSTSSLNLLSSMCDIKENSSDRKVSQDTIAATAAQHAAVRAAEKRAMAALWALRDACFQRDNPTTRKAAVEAAVGVAVGRFKAHPVCEQKALQLVVNVLYLRSDAIGNEIVKVAIKELEAASKFAQETYTEIQKANKKKRAENGKGNAVDSNLAPESDEEKTAMDFCRKSVVLIMALSAHKRPEMIQMLFEWSSAEKADVLSKTVRQEMYKLATSAATLYGTAAIALQVATASSRRETPLLISFLEALAGQKKMPEEDLAEFVEACHEIQETKAEGKRKDARYLIPVVFAMKREELVAKMAEFVDADDDVFLASLVKMASRLRIQNLLFRDEPDPEVSPLKGMTLCEQLVFLHQMDFEAAGLPQRRYLDGIRLCLENETVFEDRVVQSALDQMSGTFLTGSAPLPLAFMRTCIVVATKRESMHNWICLELLPRLVKGKIYEDRRQWEGWMRCAKMLESIADTGVSSKSAIEGLPSEQLENYRTRYGSS